MKVQLELQPCCWDRSGIGTYTYELAKRMRDGDGLEFCGNVFNFLGRRDNSQALSGIDMPIYVCKVFPYGVYRRAWNYMPVRYNQLFQNHADLSVFFNFIVPPRVDGKVVTVIHDVTYLRYPETVKKSNLTHLVKGIEYSIQRSDKVLTTSQFTKQELQTLLKVPENKIDVVYSAPSFSDELLAFSEVSNKYAIQGSYILFVSTIEPRKNVVRLLRAFERLKKHHKIPHQLVLAGGRGWCDEEIQQALESSPCKEDIILTGYVSIAEKNTLYKNASVFVFPSIYEGFGMPPLEAMHWRCPIVCSNVASIPEVVGDAAQFVDPMDETSIAEGILRVLMDQELASKLIDRGTVQAKKYTWEHSAQDLKRVCKTVLAGL